MGVATEPHKRSGYIDFPPFLATSFSTMVEGDHPSFCVVVSNGFHFLPKFILIVVALKVQVCADISDFFWTKGTTFAFSAAHRISVYLTQFSPPRFVQNLPVQFASHVPGEFVGMYPGTKGDVPFLKSGANHQALVGASFEASVLLSRLNLLSDFVKPILRRSFKLIHPRPGSQIQAQVFHGMVCHPAQQFIVVLFCSFLLVLFLLQEVSLQGLDCFCRLFPILSTSANPTVKHRFG
jgi:hypothetical protein